MTSTTLKILTGPAILGSVVLLEKKKYLKQDYFITRNPVYRKSLSNNSNRFKPINRRNYINHNFKYL